MQSNAAKTIVAIGSLAAIVILFVVFSGGDDGDESTQAAQATEATTTDATTTGADSSGTTEPAEPPKPEFETIVVEGGEPKGGVAKLAYTKGDRVRLEVRSDIAEHVHVHGYDLFEDVPAGGKAKLSFDADIDGVFEVELEDSAVQIAQLTVKP
jgi:hypothetical protein